MKHKEIFDGMRVRLKKSMKGQVGVVVKARARNRFMRDDEPDRVHVLFSVAKEWFVRPRDLVRAE